MTRAALLAYIDNNVYPNANNEITALMVRDVLHRMVDFLGDAATYGVGDVALNNGGLVTGGAVQSAINTTLSSAIMFQGVTTTPLTDGSTNPNITIDGESYTAHRGDEVIYGGKEFLWTGTMWQQLGDEESWAAKTITISAGTGLTGGGNLTQNRTLSLSQDSIEKLALAASAYQLPGTGIPLADLASGVQSSLGKADSAYQLPQGGIPKTDLASAVQNSLGKADTVAGYFSNDKLKLQNLPDLYVARTQVSGTAANKTLYGVNGISAAAAADANDKSLIEWDDTNKVWHVHGGIYAEGVLSGGGLSQSSPGGGGGGLDPALMWKYLTNDPTLPSNPYANTKIAEAHLPDLNPGTGISASYSGNLYLNLSLNYSAVAGQLGLSGMAYKPANQQTIIDALGYTPANASALNDYVTLATAQTITGRKTYHNTGIFNLDGVGSYNEGIRCNLSNYSDPWASVVIGGAYDSVSGRGEGVWTLCTNSKNFYFGHDGSSDATYGLSWTYTGALNFKTSAFTNNGNTIWHSGNFTPGNYVTLAGAQTITGAKTFTQDIVSQGSIYLTTTATAASNPTYISAGPGYSSASGKYGVRILATDQSDSQCGLGSDVVGDKIFDFSVIGGRNTSSYNGFISFVFHDVNSTNYTRAGYFNYHGDFYVTRNIYEGGALLSNKYLALSGGTLQADAGNFFNLNATSSANCWQYFRVGGTDKASVGYYNGLAFVANEATYARIGVNDAGVPQYWPSTNSADAKTLYHSGNLTKSVLTGLLDASGGYYLPLTGGTMTGHISWGDVYKNEANGWAFTEGLAILSSVNRSDTGSFANYSTALSVQGRYGFQIGVTNNISDIRFRINGTNSIWYKLWNEGNSNKSDVAWACSTLTASSTISTAAGNSIYIGTPGSSGTSSNAGYISAGPGYSINSGRYGVRVLACDQSDAQTGLGQDCVTPTGWSNAYNFCLVGGNSPSSDYGYISFVTHKAYSTSYRYLGGFYDNAGTVTFQVIGTVHASTGIWTEGYLSGGGLSQSSDQRLKRFIEDFSYTPDLLMALRPREWDWNDKTPMMGHAAGFVAQEVEGLLPYMVDDTREYLALYYDQFHALEVSALQDHERRIVELEKAVEDRDRQIAELRKRLNMN